MALVPYTYATNGVASLAALKAMPERHYRVGEHFITVEQHWAPDGRGGTALGFGGAFLARFRIVARSPRGERRRARGVRARALKAAAPVRLALSPPPPPPAPRALFVRHFMTRRSCRRLRPGASRSPAARASSSAAGAALASIAASLHGAGRAREPRPPAPHPPRPRRPSFAPHPPLAPRPSRARAPSPPPPSRRPSATDGDARLVEDLAARCARSSAAAWRAGRLRAAAALGRPSARGARARSRRRAARRRARGGRRVPYADAFGPLLLRRWCKPARSCPRSRSASCCCC